MTVWNDHNEIKRAGATQFTSKACYLSLSDHAGTHVDAPCHFNPDPKAASIDEIPLENFYTEAICLDLSHVPLKHQITVAEMKAALEKSGQSIKPRDTVLIHMGVNRRLFGTPGYLHDFPGLHVDAVHWLADQEILMFGVEAISPAPEGEPNFKAHLACAERGITHIECLWRSRSRGRQGPLPLHCLPAADPRRHRQLRSAPSPSSKTDPLGTTTPIPRNTCRQRSSSTGNTPCTPTKPSTSIPRVTN
ncbi:MAG: cyclase family protein [Hyphomicrobiaceae bacterium]